MGRFSFNHFVAVIACNFVFGVHGLADEGAVADQAAQYFNRVTSATTPGAAVLVSRDGKILYQGGFGSADIANQTSITVDSKFRIGSISKQFTAAAILLLAEQGKLSIDDPVAKFFPDFPKVEGVTLRHLLTHTSGLHSYTERPDFYSRVTQPIEPARVMEWFRNDPPDFAPGAGFHYSNSGYFLLGEIVAQVSGKSLAQALQESLFAPLEMRDTGVFVNSAPPGGMAVGYSFQEGKYVPALDWDMSWAGGAGALYSTVGDLFRWNEALFNGRVLSDASFKSATTPVVLPDDVDGMNYGLGLCVYDVGRLPAIGHGGGLNGWSTDLMRLPEQQCTIVVLTNAQPSVPELQPGSISRVIAEKLLADEIKKLPPIIQDPTIDPKTFADFVGRYDYSGAIMTVTVEGDVLHAQLTDQPKCPIFPKGKDDFFWKVADAQVKFLRDEKGDVHAARHSQNGNTFTAVKLSADTVQLQPEQLEPFVGKYQYGLAVMTVSREGSQLYAQLTGQPKFPIFPETTTEFEWRVVEASVKFLTDADGKVTAAQHTQNGTTFDAPRIP